MILILKLSNFVFAHVFRTIHLLKNLRLTSNLLCETFMIVNVYGCTHNNFDNGSGPCPLIVIFFSKK